MQREYDIYYLIELNELIKNTASNFEVGDVVMIKDGSNNIDKETLIKRWGIDPLFKTKTAQIIKKDLFIIQHERVCPNTKILQHQVCDMLLLFESGQEIYVSSALIQKK